MRSIGALTEASSWADAVEADLAFHRALVATADSPHLIRIHELLMGEFSLSLAGNLNDEEPGFMRGEHERLLDAFRTAIRMRQSPCWRHTCRRAWRSAHE